MGRHLDNAEVTKNGIAHRVAVTSVGALGVFQHCAEAGPEVGGRAEVP